MCCFHVFGKVMELMFMLQRATSELHKALTHEPEQQQQVQSTTSDVTKAPIPAPTVNGPPLPSNETTTLDADVFETLFAHVDGDHDNALTCQELELFYYLYAAEVTGVLNVTPEQRQHYHQQQQDIYRRKNNKAVQQLQQPQQQQQ
jgi:hypothetical protein